MSRTRGRVGAALVLALAATPAAAVQARMDRPALCAAATAVAIGEVTGTEAAWRQDGLLETRADVVVSQVVRGRAPEQLVVAVPGGVAAGLALTVSEAPTLRADRRYLLYLAPRGDGAWAIVGGPQGAVAIPWEADADTFAAGACDA